MIFNSDSSWCSLEKAHRFSDEVQWPSLKFQNSLVLEKGHLKNTNFHFELFLDDIQTVLSAYNLSLGRTLKLEIL